MSNPFINVNQRLEDEHNDRLRRIRLIERETKEMAPIWVAKQATMFPTALQITPTPTLGQVIIDESQNNAKDEDVLLQRAEIKLRELTDNKITQYILDRLDVIDLYYLVNSWDGLLKNLKEKYTSKGLDKDLFIALVKKNATDKDDLIATVLPIDLSTRGKIREQQKQDREIEIQDRLDAKRVEDEANKQQNETYIDKDAEDLKNATERQIRIDNKKKLLKKLQKGRLLAAMKDIDKGFKFPDPSAATVQQPTPVVDNTDFVFDPTKDTLNQINETNYIKVSQKEIRKLDSMTDLEIESMYKNMLAKYPTKVGSIMGADDKEKVVSFLKQKLLDDFFIKQTKSDLLKQQQQALQNQPIISQKTRQEVLMGKSKKELLIGARTYGKIPTKTNKPDLVDIIVKSEIANNNTPTIGLGFNKKKIIGRGAESESSPRKGIVLKKIINGKYIDLGKLKNNIICIRYEKTGTLIPTVKVKTITLNTKEIIDDIINDKYDKRLYEKLNINEKRLIKRIVDSLKLDIDVFDKTDEEYKRQFEIVMGEYQAGNNSPAIKNKLKQYVMESLESGNIPRREAFKILFELANN